MRKKLTKAQEKDLAALAALPDELIDTTDIPVIKDLTGGVAGLFYRPGQKPVTIRLSAPDAQMARHLSKSKGIPYQAYIKKLLHEALQRAAANQQNPRSQ